MAVFAIGRRPQQVVQVQRAQCFLQVALAEGERVREQGGHLGQVLARLTHVAVKRLRGGDGAQDFPEEPDVRVVQCPVESEVMQLAGRQ
jgi:hypothetical protein